jgi:hypothetical protein
MTTETERSGSEEGRNIVSVVPERSAILAMSMPRHEPMIPRPFPTALAILFDREKTREKSAPAAKTNTIAAKPLGERSEEIIFV